MYFVAISKLKQDLAEDSWRGSFPYFIAYFSLDALVVSTWGMVPGADIPTSLDVVDAGLYFAVMVLGTIAAYYSNGGRAGKGFLDRYFALAWVLGVRFLLILLLPLLLLVYWAWTDESYPEETVWQEVAVYSLTMVVYYWRLSMHIREVAYVRA